MEVLELVRNLTCQRVNRLPIYFSLSLSLSFVTSSVFPSNIEHDISLAILISIFIIQSRSLHFSCDFDLHLPHPISITPSSLSELEAMEIASSEASCSLTLSIFWNHKIVVKLIVRYLFSYYIIFFLAALKSWLTEIEISLSLTTVCYCW